ncbi:MAG: Rrf2 family transcriptional regulator [Phycisphaeraceae bacterium]|nr:Rrf2 family transcriptional regulator [Phycisphaeraceae bacterium]
MFSQTAEYALRAVVWLAGHRENAQAATQIAQATQVPPGYLSKILNTLGRARLVVARRGLHGGFMLSRAPEAISILEVINAVDPIRRITACPLNLKAHATTRCALHPRLDDAIGTVERVLAETTVADVMADKRPVHPLGDPACGGRVAAPAAVRRKLITSS